MRHEDEMERFHLVAAAAAERLGRRIRELRGRRAMTLDELASASGVSKAMLSKVERGETNLSLLVAAKVAAALAVTLSELVGVEERPRPITITKSERTTFRDAKTGYEQEIFPAFEGGPLTLARVTIPAGSGSGPLPPHQRTFDIYLLVERGALRVTVGSALYTLHEGDAFSFRADVPHRFENAGADACVYLAIGV